MFSLQYVVPAPSPLIVFISEAIKIASVSFSRKNLLHGFVACFPYTMTNPTFVDLACLPSKLEGKFLTQLWLLGTPVAQVWYLVQTRSISLLCQCRVISNNSSRPSHNQKLLNENYILIIITKLTLVCAGKFAGIQKSEQWFILNPTSNSLQPVIRLWRVN